MILFAAGMARSGSMWAFNATRELIRRAGKIPLPHTIPPDEKKLIGEAIKQNAAGNQIYCIKTHIALRPNLPDTKIIFTYRDVREAMVSYMQFIHCDFDWAMQAAASMMSTVDYYFEVHKTNIIRIKYDRIVSDPAGVIQDINAFLEFHVSPGDIRLIAEQLSRERVKKFIESLNTVKIAGNGMITDPALREDFETVGNLDGSFRVYDKKSAFQSHHITNSGERWRALLTGEQQDQVMAMAKEWLVKYGFSLEP